MYSMQRKEFVHPDMEMVGRVLDALNEKFDPTEVYHHKHSTEMFECHIRTDGMKREEWEITFLGKRVLTGGEFGIDYSECQDEKYLTLETHNEQKILMLATNGAINYISDMMQYFAFSNASNQNKQKWADILKKGLK